MNCGRCFAVKPNLCLVFSPIILGVFSVKETFSLFLCFITFEQCIITLKENGIFLWVLGKIIW